MKTRPQISLLLAATAVLGIAGCSSAPDPIAGLSPAPKAGTVELWPGTPPHQVENPTPERLKDRGIVDNIHVPTLSIHLAPQNRRSGTAVLICPGGGYALLAMGHEGREVAAWLNGLGIDAFVLKYRCQPYRHPIPLMDGQRAMRWIHAHAAELGIATNQIGILGFSAGGHLASTVSTRWDLGRTDSTDPIERQSCRPDFTILIYPVITMSKPFAHQGSIKNLLGPDATEQLKKNLSSELQVHSETPPAFLAHGRQDQGVPLANSHAYFNALRSSKVDARFVPVDRPGHGWGLQDAWIGPCATWLRQRHLIR